MHLDIWSIFLSFILWLIILCVFEIYLQHKSIVNLLHFLWLIVFMLHPITIPYVVAITIFLACVYYFLCRLLLKLATGALAKSARGAGFSASRAHDYSHDCIRAMPGILVVASTCTQHNDWFVIAVTPSKWCRLAFKCNYRTGILIFR